MGYSSALMTGDWFVSTQRKTPSSCELDAVLAKLMALGVVEKTNPAAEAVTPCIVKPATPNTVGEALICTSSEKLEPKNKLTPPADCHAITNLNDVPGAQQYL
jgi:hypothetical protein